MRRVLFVFAFVCCFASTSLYASTIFSENFDQIPLAQTGLTLTQAGQFHTINGTNIDVVSAANGWAGLVVPPESGNVVDMGGTGGSWTGQLQTINAITLGPGTYTLNFDLNGSQRGPATTTEVMIGPRGGPSILDKTITLASGDVMSFSDPFTVATSTDAYLTFILLDGGNNIGSLLDDVSISSVPEPGTLLLLGSGLTALAGMVRRFRGNRA